MKGQRVLEIGDAVREGIVIAVQSGTEVRDMYRKMLKSDFYTDELGYDLDVNWVQSTTQIPNFGLGIPLVNLRGEVLGIASWTGYIIGHGNVAFFVSATDMAPLISMAGTKVMPLTKLPAGISHPSEPPEAEIEDPPGGGERAQW